MEMSTKHKNTCRTMLEHYVSIAERYNPEKAQIIKDEAAEIIGLYLNSANDCPHCGIEMRSKTTRWSMDKDGDVMPEDFVLECENCGYERH